MIFSNLEKVGRDFTLSGKEFHNFIVEGKKDLELVCRRHQKLLQIRWSLAQQKTFGRLPKRPLKIVVLPKPDINCNFNDR
jgi:hypothetical protein